MTDLEKQELNKLDNNENLKNALRKVIADNSAGIIFNMLNLFDGTGSPKQMHNEWTGVKLIDEEPNENEPEFKDEHYGKLGSAKRDKLEKGFEAFKLGALIHEARLEQGLTQEQLADKCGTNKAYISRVENNIKDVRISTLQKIVELGFGGQLQLSIKL